MVLHASRSAPGEGFALLTALRTSGARLPEPSSPVDRVKRHLDLFEIATKVVVAVELSYLREFRSMPAVLRAALAESMTRPSLGHWIAYHRHAQPVLKAAGWPPSWDWILPLENRHQMVRIRNTFAHSNADDLLDDPALAVAMAAIREAVDGSTLLREAVARPDGAPLPSGLRECAVWLPFLARAVDTSPLPYWRTGDGAGTVLVFHSAPPVKGELVPWYGTVDGRKPVRLKQCAATFSRRFPLERWRLPHLPPLGAAAHVAEAPIGRQVEREAVASFLRSGEGAMLIDGVAGQGKTSLLASVLADLQGTRGVLMRTHDPPFFKKLEVASVPSTVIEGLQNEREELLSHLARCTDAAPCNRRACGERRSLWHEYEDNVDWTDPGHVSRVLRVYETLLDEVGEEAIESTRRFLDRQGFDLEAGGRIKPKPDSLAAVAVRLPRSLGTLRDPTMILDSFDRINRALPTDPAQAIGSAKELVEATAKTVLIERGVPFDDKTAKLPALIDLAQRTLLLHPQTQVPGPDGSNAVKRILGGLMSVAIGLGELRNEGWGTGHAPAAPRVGLRPRHAHLAVGAAHTWCQLILDTLADPTAPWRSQTITGQPANSTA